MNIVQEEVQRSSATLTAWCEQPEPRHLGTSQAAVSVSFAQFSREPSEQLTGIEPPPERRILDVNSAMCADRLDYIRRDMHYYGVKDRYAEPEIVTDPTAHPMLTDRIQRALRDLLPQLSLVAQVHYVRVTRVEVRGFSDPGEDTMEVVVSQHVMLSAHNALDYWDKLGAAVDVWANLVSEDMARLLTDRISIEVRWE